MIPRHFFLAIAVILLAGVAAAQLTGETPLSPPQYGPISGQSGPAVASDGTNFLVAWIDSREPGSICANRVTRTGEILDGTGIRVSGDPADPGSSPFKILGLFHIDGVYTLLYKNLDIYHPPPFPVALYAVIISDDGLILDAGHKVFEGPAGLIAASGSRILVSSSNALFVLNGHAEIISRQQLPDSGGYYSRLASNGSTFLLVTFVRDDISHSLNLMVLDALDANGQPTATSVIPTNGPDAWPPPDIQSDGDGYLVLYYDSILGNVALSVSAHAEIRSTSLFNLPPGTYETLLCWTGQGYLLVALTSSFQPHVALAVMNVDRTGSAAGPSRSPGYDVLPTGMPSLASNGSDTLEIWLGSEAEGSTVRGALVDPDGTAHSSVMTIPSTSNAQSSPVIATGGIYDLAVWEELTGIYATRVAADGTALDGRGILVSGQTTASLDLHPYTLRVIFDGTAYLVAWGPGSAKGQRIDPASGLLLGPTIPLASCGSFDLGYDGTSLIVFAACDQTFSAQRLGTTGVTGAPLSIWSVGTDVSQPRAAWNGHEWLVAWTETRGGSNVYFALLSGALTAVLDTQPFSAPPFDDQLPLVASDGQDFVIVWTHYYSDSLYFRQVYSDGSFGDISTLVPHSFGNASLAWDGVHYTIAYSVPCATGCQTRSYLSHFGVQDDHPVLFYSLPIGESSFLDVALAGSTNGRVRIVYTRTALEPLYGGSVRAFLRDDHVELPRHRAAAGSQPSGRD